MYFNYCKTKFKFLKFITIFLGTRDLTPEEKLDIYMLNNLTFLISLEGYDIIS